MVFLPQKNTLDNWACFCRNDVMCVPLFRVFDLQTQKSILLLATRYFIMEQSLPPVLPERISSIIFLIIILGILSRRSFDWENLLYAGDVRNISITGSGLLSPPGEHRKKVKVCLFITSFSWTKGWEVQLVFK